MFESVFENLMVFNKFGLFARMTHNQTKFTINVTITASIGKTSS